MLKRGRKGRISNELVAASCAAIMAVYAAGSWRTRDEARRFGVEGEMRRPVRPAQVPAASIPAVVAVPVSHVVPPVPPAMIKPRQTAKKSVKVVSAPSLPPAALSPSSRPAIAAPEPASEATAAADAALSAPPSRKRWLDGYYTGWGQSPHGDMQAFVRIEDGKIIDAGVATCETRYPCSVINGILLQPIDLQGPDVDRVSRATESGDAYYYGLVKALENAETGTYKSVRP